MKKYYNYNKRSCFWIKKVAITVFLVWLFLGCELYGQTNEKTITPTENEMQNDKLLITALTGKKWEQLPPLFSDDSYQTLKTYFENARSIIITPSYPNLLNYKAKFDLQGEMGILAFEKKEGKYLNMLVNAQVKPLSYIEKFKIYKANNTHITLGDAQIDFVSGFFYESQPDNFLLVFKGHWTISITPNDKEEKLTLNRLYKKDSFEKTNETGIFMLEKKDFLNSLRLFGETVVPDPESQTLFDAYRELYGIDVEQFNEYWYLPFPEETNLVIFEKEKNSHYFYLYNESQSPDTQLTESDSDRIILNYNAYKNIKLRFGSGSGISRLNLNIYFNPMDNFISGTAVINYKNQENVRELRLAEGLEVVGNLIPKSQDLDIFRKKDKYYFLGNVPETLSLYYRGRINSSIESLELFKSLQDTAQHESPTPDTSLFYFLSWTQNFYPNPGEDFLESSITVNLPAGLNCLASGNFTGKSENSGDTQSFKFANPASKGISLVIGNFNLTQKQNAIIPLHFYTYESFHYPKNLDLTEIKDAFNTFSRHFSPLDLSAVNILLKRGKLEGGVSNNGFVVVLLPYEKSFFHAKEPASLEKLLTERKIFSPILIRNRTEDLIIHELAHQWWGGLISWKSYQDVWLTEGLAHFSVLYYLKNKLSPREFNRIIRELKHWVYRYNDSGPIIYGPRINSLENKNEAYEAYQSIIYNKSALVLFMLMDLIGEKEFDHRLQEVLKKYKYQSLNSMQFINEFSSKDKMIKDFFRKWIYSKTIPLVELTLVEDDEEMDKKDFKKVVIRVTQLDTDFIFPLKLRVTTKKGASIETVIIKAKEQDFIIKRDATIRTIEVADSDYLIKEKKQPPPYFPVKEN